MYHKICIILKTGGVVVFRDLRGRSLNLIQTGSACVYRNLCAKFGCCTSQSLQICYLYFPGYRSQIETVFLLYLTFILKKLSWDR